MKNKYELLSGAQFDEASDIAIKLKVLAGEIYNAQTELEWFKRQMFAETATGSCLDLIAAQRGLERKSATKAKGKILALTVDGVAKAGAVGRYRGDGTVDVFISGNGTKASSQMVSKVQLLLNEKRELNVDVKVSAANMVTYDLDVVLYKKNEFTDEEVKAKCLEAFKDYINSIGIGGRVYLSGLGRYLLNTGCLENYEFNSTMDDMSLSKSQCFTAGSAVMVVS